MSLQSAVDIVRSSEPLAREAKAESATLALCLCDQFGNIVLDGRNPAGWAALLASVISGSDLTVAGTLTTLATNVGAHTTQGTLLRDALFALTANIVFAGKVAFKVIETPVAAAGTDATTAAQLGSANFLYISSDSAAKGVKLVAGVAGDYVEVLNTSSAAAVLYPATGGAINGLTANAGVVIPASRGVRLVCSSANTWTAINRDVSASAA